MDMHVCMCVCARTELYTRAHVFAHVPVCEAGMPVYDRWFLGAIKAEAGF